MLIDMPLEALQAYAPEPTLRPDFDAYWRRTLAEAGEQPLNVEAAPLEYPVDDLMVADVRYDGWRGARIAGYYLARRGARNLPGLVCYHGYSGSKGYIHEYLSWALQGYAVLAVDVRGQSGRARTPVTTAAGVCGAG